MNTSPSYSITAIHFNEVPKGQTLIMQTSSIKIVYQSQKVMVVVSEAGKLNGLSALI